MTAQEAYIHLFGSIGKTLDILHTIRITNPNTLKESNLFQLEIAKQLLQDSIDKTSDETELQ